MSDLVRAYTDRSHSVVEIFKQYSRISDSALEHLWLPEEVKVEKDKQAILTMMTPAERHGTITVLKLFTMYEVRAGEDFWGDRFRRIMKGPEFTRMASTFSMFELAVHKPFYQKINEVLNLDTDDFYNEYLDDPQLKGRMDFIDQSLKHPNDLVALGIFSLVEGGILYSNLGWLKHFSANGKNTLNQIPRGINFTTFDENLHQQASAQCFRHLVADATEDGVFADLYGNRATVNAEIVKAANIIYEHEAAVIDKIFEKGPVSGIDAASMRVFVQQRLNNCCGDLNIPAPFEVNPETDTISEWFYANIQGYQSNDFFAGIGNAYNRAWPEDRFIFTPHPASENGATSNLTWMDKA